MRPQTLDETLLPTRQVLGRYSVGDRTIARWLADASLSFPRPLVVNRRRYWRLGDLQSWELDRAAAHAGSRVTG